jgi:hypothetical protein
MSEEGKQLGKEQNPNLNLKLALDHKHRLDHKAKVTTTERERLRKSHKHIQNGRMQPEKPCPLSKERRDSTHLRICREKGDLCHDTKFLFSWAECPIFLGSQKTNRKESDNRYE